MPFFFRYTPLLLAWSMEQTWQNQFLSLSCSLSLLLYLYFVILTTHLLQLQCKPSQTTIIMPFWIKWKLAENDDLVQAFCAFDLHQLFCYCILRITIIIMELLSAKKPFVGYSPLLSFIETFWREILKVMFMCYKLFLLLAWCTSIVYAETNEISCHIIKWRVFSKKNKYQHVIIIFAYWFIIHDILHILNSLELTKYGVTWDSDKIKGKTML